MRAFSVALMLVAVGLTFAPGVSAEETDCKEIHRKVVQGVIVHVDEDCSTQVDVKVQQCISGGYWDTTEAGPMTVRVYKCGPPHAASVDVAGPCPSETFLGIGTLSLNSNCYATLEVKFYDCLWGGYWVEAGNKIAKVRVYQCNSTPPTAATSPCTNLDGSTWAASFEGESDCTFRIHAVDGDRVCPYGYRNVHVDGKPASYSADVCQVPIGTGTEAQPCDGFWYYETEVGPAKIGTNGQLRCTYVELDRP